MIILNESLFEKYANEIVYKPVSNIDKFKKYADEILGGYGGMSDSDIKRDIEEIYIDDELKGYIGLSKYNEEDGTKLLGIGNFMILERGKGYGTQVIKDIVSKYKNEYDLIYCFVDSDNEGAISLYKKLGKVYDEDGPNDNGQYYVTFYDNGKYKLEEDYDPPYNAQQIKDNYGIELYNKLIKDPAHRWRMETGIELIHKEPTKEELERIWKNWQEMSEEQKEKSDKKSLELFGKTNEENYNSLIGLYESNQNMSKQLFFLSDKNMDGKTLEPRVPNNFLIKNGYEDSKSKRVCFAPSIDKALMAISQNLKGKKFFVHTPVDANERYIYQPSVKEVPDVKITGEVWYTTPIKLKTIGQIEVIEDDGLPGHTYTYGKDNSAELYGWNWEWVDSKMINESLNIDEIETPEQLMDWMESNITYELANDEYGAEDDPPTKTSEEVIETGTGHCAEQSYLEYKVLDELGYFPQLVFVKENNSKKDYGADGSAHMFVVYQDDDEKYTYFEHSQEHSKGIHKFNSMSELLDFVGKNWWRYDANSDILEVRYIDEPITGVDNWKLAQECHKYPVDEVLDISNNVMEDEVPQDAKWDYNKHKIIEENLTEAKRKRKKRISQVNPGEAIFKSVKDMQKWVKKRQKGMGYFVHMDCGNMDYNNNMFNKMHGLGDASSSSTTDGGVSDAAPSGGDVGGSVGMGESFEMNKNKAKLSPNLIKFMKEHKDLINRKDWDILFLDYAEWELSEEDQSQLIQALISIGCDIEVMD